MADQSKRGVGREKCGPATRRPAEYGTTWRVKAQQKTTLSEAHRERLGRRVLDREMLAQYKSISGEIFKAGDSPTWAEFVAVKMAHRASAGSAGTRDAKELREASEKIGSGGVGKPDFLLGTKGLARTNAVTGAVPKEADAKRGWRA